MKGIEYDRPQLEEMISRIVNRTMRMDLIWDWPCGVAYYGIARAYEVTGCKEYLELLKGRIDEHMELGVPKPWTVNACAMGHALITLYEATGEEKYWELVLSKIQYLKNDALRFGDNVLQHTVSAKNDFPEQCWADTLFMAAYFMIRVGVKEKDEELLEDALNQYYWHLQYLQNKETGLWYHGYNHISKDHMSGIYWGRANAWAAYTMSEAWKLVHQGYLYPKYMTVSASLNEHLSALKIYQTENGLWRTIVDDKDSYEEVSASCGIAAAMVVKGNPLHKKYVDRTMKGIMQYISEDGRVLNVSGGTAVMKDSDGYRNISREWIQGWGQGLALTLLTSILAEQ